MGYEDKRGLLKGEAAEASPFCVKNVMICITVHDIIEIINKACKI